LQSAIATVPFWRAVLLLTRARLAPVVHVGVQEDFPAHAERATAETESLRLPCFDDDVRMLRASIAVARGDYASASLLLSQIADRRPRESGASLPELFAARAQAQLHLDSEAKPRLARIEQWITQRGITNPRRFSRLFMPGLQASLRAAPGPRAA
jgi:hypothetical protein